MTLDIYREWCVEVKVAKLSCWPLPLREVEKKEMRIDSLSLEVTIEAMEVKCVTYRLSLFDNHGIILLTCRESKKNCKDWIIHCGDWRERCEVTSDSRRHPWVWWWDGQQEQVKSLGSWLSYDQVIWNESTSVHSMASNLTVESVIVSWVNTPWFWSFPVQVTKHRSLNGSQSKRLQVRHSDVYLSCILHNNNEPFSIKIITWKTTGTCDRMTY